ncbi:hypothetical protein [Streptomyces sp. NPDC001530]
MARQSPARPTAVLALSANALSVPPHGVGQQDWDYTRVFTQYTG